MSKLLLLLGPSGVGKTTLINYLRTIDDRFTYIAPYMTRCLRHGEKDKVPISDAKMEELRHQDEFLAINELYGVRYATPRSPIVNALDQGVFPVIDWPVDRLDVMTHAFPQQLHVVYVVPPSYGTLRARLAQDGRDENGDRFHRACQELRAFRAGRMSRDPHLVIVSKRSKLTASAHTIYRSYCGSL